MGISLIVAMDKNRVIGYENDIPWRIPNDWAYVRETTEGSTLIMGRKNFETIGRALPNRRTIILTRDEEYAFEGCETAHSVEHALEMSAGEKVFIFGGEQVYKLFMPMVNKMYITEIDGEFKGDTYFPGVDIAEWEEESAVKGVKDKENPHEHIFHVYNRKVTGAGKETTKEVGNGDKLGSVKGSPKLKGAEEKAYIYLGKVQKFQRAVLGGVAKRFERPLQAIRWKIEYMNQQANLRGVGKYLDKKYGDGKGNYEWNYNVSGVNEYGIHRIHSVEVSHKGYVRSFSVGRGNGGNGERKLYADVPKTIGVNGCTWGTVEMGEKDTRSWEELLAEG